MNESDLILDEFLIEAGEIFDQLDLDFVAIEKNSADRKLIGSIFRAMHSLKGSSRFCGFRRLERLTHYSESLLSEVREGSLTLNTEIIDTLLRVSDQLRALIAEITTRRSEPDGDDSALVAELERHIGRGASPTDEGETAVAHPQPQQVDTRVFPAETRQRDAEPLPNTFDTGADVTSPESVISPFSSVALAPAEPHEPATSAATAPRANEAAAPVRVSIELLDTLMNLVGEMVLARNRLLAFGEQSTDSNFTGTVRAIDSITMALQERMMKTRMQPLAQLWSKFPRLVRDIAQECGKQIDLVQVGGDTELDRALIDAVRDPLMHIIRNCIDHGIEDSSLRQKRNKPPHGTITLGASHVNGSVVIEVSDDGGGIDVQLVGRKALEKGLVSAERLARLSEREVLDLIFVPGFSTRDQITNVSGRGVGMDVVRNNLQRIGGGIEIATSSRGTHFRLRIPLTLAIMPALFVKVGEERFAVPQIALFEMVRQAPPSGEPSFEMYHDIPVFRLRNRLLPLLCLGRELGLSTVPLDPTRPLNIVVVQAAEQRFGLVVDEVLFMQEVVVKPVSSVVRSIGVFSGATILGDGCVCLILDIPGIAERARLLGGLSETADASRSDVPVTADEGLIPMLLVDLDSVDRVAIPLDYVDRLEMIPGSRIEHRGNEDVVIVGDQIMPLVWLSSYVDDASRRLFEPDQHLPVIVHRIHDQPIGLVVTRIHDITGVPPMVTMVSPALRGFLGSAIVDERVVSILDVPGILRDKGLDIPAGPAHAYSARMLGVADNSHHSAA